MGNVKIADLGTNILEVERLHKNRGETISNIIIRTRQLHQEEMRMHMPSLWVSTYYVCPNLAQKLQCVLDLDRN